MDLALSGATLGKKQMTLDLITFMNNFMRDGERYVPARLQSALALLERLRVCASLDLADHAAKGSSGLTSHESFGRKAHERWDIEPINKNHGRRSSHLHEWGQALLDMLATTDFSSKSEKRQAELINKAQEPFVDELKRILEQDPLIVSIRGRTVEHVIREVLRQAQAKRKAGDVAQYLVGAKLCLRLGRDIPANPVNKSDRKSWQDGDARAGDFEIENAVIEVAVGLPDPKHIQQIAEILRNSSCEVWLLTSADRVTFWRAELDRYEGMPTSRLVVSAVESFVGQNITEMGDFSDDGKVEKLEALFAIYNEKWVKGLTTPGIQIITR
jgi:hypothetical protein